MEALFRFLAHYEVLIYFILAAGLLITSRWLWRAVRESQDAIYALEQQFAMRHLTTAIVAILLIGMLVLGELYITSFLVPDLPVSTFLLTPTVDVVSEFPATPLSESNSPSSEISVIAATVIPESKGCLPGSIMITDPAPGQELSGVVEIYGSVDVKDLGFYKFEFSPQGLETWATFYAGREIEPDEPIGVWDTTQLVPGDYQLKLVTTDNQGREFPPCIINIRVTGG